MLRSLTNSRLLRLSVSGNVLHVRLKAFCDAEQLQHLSAALDEMAQKNPRGFVLLVSVAQFPMNPAGEERQVTMAMLRKHQAQIKAAAVVLDGEGLLLAIVRTVINTIFLGAQLRQFRLLNDMLQAAQWVLPHLADCTDHPPTYLQLVEDSKANVREVKSAPSASVNQRANL